MSVILLTICILLSVATLVLTFRPVVPAAITACAALYTGSGSGYVQITDRQLVFWSVATVLVLGIYVLLPKSMVRSTRGMGYIAGGSIAGAAVGLTLSAGAMIAASAVGAFLGALAYSRTAEGRVLEFPSLRFRQYICAKGLPTVVAVSMTGLICIHLLNI